LFFYFDLRLEEVLFPLAAGDLDLDLDLDLEGEREREAGGPRATPDAARLAVAVLRGLGVAGLVTAAVAFFAFFGLVEAGFFAFDGLRPLAEEEADGLRPRPDPVPVVDLLLVLAGLVLDLLLAGFFDLVTRAGDLLRLLRAFFSAAGLGFDFFSDDEAFLAAVGDKRKLCLF